MPYKDKAKDRDWHKSKMWNRRHGVTPNVTPSVTSKLEAVGLKMEGNRIIDLIIIRPKEITNDVPLYDPSIHKPGDRVMIKSPYSKKMQEIVIPLVDADGHSYEE